MTPLLPPQSPARVGEDPAAVPVMAMSLKSQSVALSVPTLSVRWVPRVLERTKMRRTGEAPETVRVPVMVALPKKATCLIPAAAGAVTIILLNALV